MRASRRRGDYATPFSVKPDMPASNRSKWRAGLMPEDKHRDVDEETLRAIERSYHVSAQTISRLETCPTR
jgi:hypothetical protein